MSDPLAKLIRRARSKLWLAAIIRLIGARLAILSAVALMLAVLSRWVPLIPLPILYVTAAILLLSLLLQLRRLPGTLIAAMEVDRQSGSADLLSTATTIGSPVPTIVEQAIISRARQRASDIDLSRFVAGHYGIYWWVAVLVLAGLVPVFRVPAHPVTDVPHFARPLLAPPMPRREITARPPTHDVNSASARGALSQRDTEAAISDNSSDSSAGKTSSPGGSRGQLDSNTAGGGISTGQSRVAEAGPAPLPSPNSPARQPADNSSPAVGTSDTNSAGEYSRGTVSREAPPQSPEVVDGGRPPESPHAQAPLDVSALPRSYRDVVGRYFSR